MFEFIVNMYVLIFFNKYKLPIIKLSFIGLIYYALAPNHICRLDFYRTYILIFTSSLFKILLL